MAARAIVLITSGELQSDALKRSGLARLPRIRRLVRPARPVALALGVAALCGGCAGSTHRTAAGAGGVSSAPSSGTAGSPGLRVPATATRACVHTVVATIAQIAHRSYAEAASGRIVAQAVKRVSTSQALAGAVARGDAPAARAAVLGLLAHQISFMQVQRGARVLARVGDGSGIAPARGELRDANGRPVGRYVLALQGADGYVLNTAGLTGARVLVRRGSRQLAGSLQPGPSHVPGSGSVHDRGVTYQALSFPAQGFPRGGLRVSVLVPPGAFAACGGTREETVANVYGRLARAVYQAERSGLTSRTALRVIAGSAGFARAVAAGDAAGCNLAIQGLFGSSRHIVRVRALRGNQLVCDVGGPFALAPLRGSLRLGGRTVGRFVTSVQDDLGFVLLVRRFSAAQLVLRDSHQEIPSSTIIPAPPLPRRGRVSVGGRSYQVYSFTAERFPAGPLRVWLLVPRAA
jgi:hypothetical protein